MATAEKTQEQQKKFEVPDEYESGEDYDSADGDYSDEEEQNVPVQNNQLQRRRRQQQPKQQDELEDISDEDDYYSDEYDDEYSDGENEIMEGYRERDDDFTPSGGMNVIDEKKKSIDDEEGMKLKLELNLEIEVELKARIHGDLTLALM
ncbi:uncharacterized protein N7483_011052 [Penicillium malachiteum]|uniref:uncharacterized protein n=1 Tax=Penicillium malachiteum TaxID=1324776 RepID=UPI00254735A1|nr:uncharacterized protein N7483_011052 [Penicillium malachiteum]KAJ5713871.1 hypothetical protein N7483_011052 [Penicillium malachiteum]